MDMNLGGHDSTHYIIYEYIKLLSRPGILPLLFSLPGTPTPYLPFCMWLCLLCSRILA